MPADGVEVDGCAGKFLVAGVELPHVAVADDGVAHTPGGEIHHRVAEVAQLEIQYSQDLAAGMVELARVPDHGRFPAGGVDRVAAQPAEAELEEGVGMGLHRAVVLLVPAQSHQPGLRSVGGPLDARRDERRERQCVEPGEDGEIVVDGRSPALVAGVAEVLLAADAIHDVGHGLVDPSPHVRHGDAVLAEEPLEGHLVREREDERHVRAVAPHHQLVTGATPVDGREPDRPPARLAGEFDDRAAEVLLEPAGDVAVGGSQRLRAHHGDSLSPIRPGRRAQSVDLDRSLIVV